ncbi:mechanosensitive ion channel family protein [Fontimonas sp. SYSU GA230001]|uniref:mechanosensitive ion channel family protein n=1 Tax=Fontimonas sp. SYSU GA230001 TaxID=3142450 RepID=UPI0032B3A2E2
MTPIAGAAWALFARPELPFLIAVAAVVALLLRRGAPADRQSLRGALIFFGLCLLVELAGALLEAAGAPHAGPLTRNAGILATGLALIRLVGLGLFRALLPRIGVTTPRIVEDVALVIAALAWGMVRLRMAGVDLGSLVTTSAVITAVLAFAMQDTLGNVLGGLFLELDDSLTVGDWIQLDDLSGRVVDIRWRHTAIRTRNGETVIVPNSALMKSRFTVIGNPDTERVRWRRWVRFEVGFDTPPAQVLAVAERAVRDADIVNVATDPPPQCVLLEFGPSQHRYALRYWLIDPQPDDATDSVVRLHLRAALERAGIALALPKSVIYRVADDEAHQRMLRARELEARIHALQSVELFASLTREELEALAGYLVHAPFAAGAVITRQGAIAHWLYLLVGGSVEVWLETGHNGRQLLATLTPGTVFGEMGMMTGEPRRATVTAKTDVECYRLDKKGFEHILRARPAIAEEVSRVLAARAGDLSRAAEEAAAQASLPRAAPDKLLERIRAFFGLDRPGGK